MYNPRNMAKGIFADLQRDGQLSTITDAVARTVQASFSSHPCINITKRELKRRVDMCTAIIEHTRGDMHWSVSKVVDHLLPFLKVALDGGDWRPGARAVWLEGDPLPTASAELLRTVQDTHRLA